MEPDLRFIRWRARQPTHGLTLGLLFTGAAVLLVMPLLAVPQGRYLSMLLREAAWTIGYGAVAMSLLSMAAEATTSPALDAGLVSLAVATGLRVVLSARTWVRDVNAQLNFSDPPAPATATKTDPTT